MRFKPSLVLPTRIASRFLLAVATPSSAKTGVAISRELARDGFVQAKQFTETDGARMWGVSLVGPIMIVDQSTREIVATHADGEGHLIAVDERWGGHLSDHI
ncbi:MAG: hypothetical protein JNL67_13265 [Planctomycetaceae bacterium]|nr:hypothetical protein [Planctomycetaceae bacterium]